MASGRGSSRRWARHRGVRSCRWDWPASSCGLLWLYRAVLSRFAKPVVNDFRTSVSVVVPAYREDPDILMECLATWLEQDPTEVIIVPDVGRHRGAATGWPRSTTRGCGSSSFEHRGKRSALGVGIRAAPRRRWSCWSTPTPAGSRGCSPRCRCRSSTRRSAASAPSRTSTSARTSVWRRIADWLVNLRYYDYVPAMGRAGAVACLSGRTAAYRRSAIMPVLAEPGERVLPRPALRRRRRRPADLAGAGLRLQDRAPVLGPGAVDVPDRLAGLRQAAGAVEPQLVPLLPDRAVEGLAVAGAAASRRSPCCRSC